MMYKTGLLDRKENVLVTDYGTNAEMAIKVGDEIITGSAAAGPAIEGQHIKAGMLASPGAISDVNGVNDWRCTVLDDDIMAKPGDVVDPNTGGVMEEGEMHGRAVGVTGTGVIAAIAEGLDSGLIKMPHITTFDRKLHLQDGVVLEEQHIVERPRPWRGPAISPRSNMRD